MAMVAMVVAMVARERGRMPRGKLRYARPGQQHTLTIQGPLSAAKTVSVFLSMPADLSVAKRLPMIQSASASASPNMPRRVEFLKAHLRGENHGELGLSKNKLEFFLFKLVQEPETGRAV